MGAAIFGFVYIPPADGYLYHYKSKKIRCRKHRGFARRARKWLAGGGNPIALKFMWASRKNKSAGCYRTVKLPKYPNPPRDGFLAKKKAEWDKMRAKRPYGI